MSKIEKLITRLKTVPKNFTWDELVKVLKHFGYEELSKKGKTGGSRRKFVNKEKDVINLHKPHPGKIVKQYAIRQVLDKIGL
jgi:predicted RNA binding protein YcfA (HicA-like mRNA interferase family)